MTRRLAIIFVLLAFVACKKKAAPRPGPSGSAAKPVTQTGPVRAAATPGKKAPTVAEARAFLAATERDLLRLWTDADRTRWVKYTYITHDTDILLTQVEERVMEYTARKAAEATRFDGLRLPAKLRRKLKLLKLALTLPAPPDAARRAELAGITTSMESTYSKGRYCSPRQQGKCLHLGKLSGILAKSRDYDELLDAWKGWRTISRPMRRKFVRYVKLANQGARSLGFSDLGALWKSRYDMPPEAFAAEMDRLWLQVKPLYQALHCYVRAKLQEKYGKARVPDGQPIPAHLLGNMWAQDWTNIVDLVSTGSAKSVNLTAALKARKVDAKGMVRYGERFFTSLGLTKLPATFWQRSMFTKPADREVVCHASAWDVDQVKDLRIKMCIKINEEDFSVIHHELGHNYYQYYHRKQPPLFLGSANDGFHEALGDTVALSVTPTYLKKVGLIRKIPRDQMGTLMNRALAGVAFLPFGLLVDKWRWDVFAGKVKPSEYNRSWWRLRTRYQGIRPPVARSEDDFDPGAKYHIPANVPYSRYFLARILQFQFHQALCKLVGHQGPLHTCSIYGSKKAGARLRAMMEMGMSRPWPEALRTLTGKTRMDGGALLAYFRPLHEWLKKQNRGRKCGW